MGPSSNRIRVPPLLQKGRGAVVQRSTEAAPTGREKILQEIENRRMEAVQEEQYFTPPPEERFARDLTKPLVIWQAWNPSVARGGSLVYGVGLANPTPRKWVALFAHFFIGPANVVAPSPPQDVGVALSAVDARFPRLTLPGFPGLTLDADAVHALGFALTIPEAVERGNYLGNCFLLRVGWHQPGEYLDRSVFVLDVV